MITRIKYVSNGHSLCSETFVVNSSLAVFVSIHKTSFNVVIVDADSGEIIAGTTPKGSDKIKRAKYWARRRLIKMGLRLKQEWRLKNEKRN